MTRLAAARRLAVAALGCGLAAGLAGPAPELAAQLPPPTRARAEVAGRSVVFDVTRHHGFPAVRAGDLDSIWEQPRQHGVFFRARLFGEELALEAGSPFFRYGDRAYQLVNAPYQRDGALWVPAAFVTDWLSGLAPQGRLAPAQGDRMTPRADPALPWRVIIDPGHGGRDPGTLGRESSEKDVVLAIGTALYEELRRRDGIDAYMTRDSDTYVEHDLRSQYAVDRGGSLFVSIHANSATDRGVRGFETIFLGPARSEEAREVALRENRGQEGAAGSPTDIQFIQTGLDRTENMTESRIFAGFVQNSIRESRRGRSRDRGVKQGPWWVLLGALARMPSVIVEVGFLSNREEERYLNDVESQRVIARSIADAVEAYRADVRRRSAGAVEGRDAAGSRAGPVDGRDAAGMSAGPGEDRDAAGSRVGPVGGRDAAGMSDGWRVERVGEARSGAKPAGTEVAR